MSETKRSEIVFLLKNEVKNYKTKKLEEIQSIVGDQMSLLFSFASHWNRLREVFSTDLEPLRGKRKGQHSIRVNDQWRICFVWEKGKVYEVELVDYHG